MKPIARTPAVVAVCAVVACGGQSEGDGNGGAGGGSGSPGFECPAKAGPAMVGIDATGTGGYCVDSTEVTQAQYAEFLASSPSPGGAAECSWNDDLAPATDTFLCEYDPGSKADHPIGCVDWCDARAYCEWAGKRLCGRLGGGTVNLETNDERELLYACSNGGDTNFPYGDSYVEGACATYVQGSNTTVPVTSKADCRGDRPPFDQIHGLLGNAEEWIDGTGTEGCMVDGSMNGAPDPATCSHRSITNCKNTGYALGFRCCADPI